MIAVSEARYVNGYKIWLKFTDGASGIVDFTDIIRRYPAARPLEDLAEFQRFYLDEWPTLAWPSGFDYSPESLYQRATGLHVVWKYGNANEERANRKTKTHFGTASLQISRSMIPEP